MPPMPARALHISIQDYLDGEALTETRHEYLDGQVVAMGGASDRHGLIAMALGAALLPLARKRGCQLFMADMKVRVDYQGETYFYYPDLVLACDPNDRASPFYRANPCLIVEVTSASTARIDRREKRLAYALLPSLREYVLVDQDRACIDIHRRNGETWTHEQVTEGMFHLACLDLEVSVAEVYADIDLAG